MANLPYYNLSLTPKHLLTTVHQQSEKTHKLHGYYFTNIDK
jgi:hypothetical protein